MPASPTLFRIRITPTVSHEFEHSAPEHLPLDKLDTGWVLLNEDELRSVLSEARYYTDPANFDVGPYDLPLGTYNAFRALARQCEAALRNHGLDPNQLAGRRT
jgi:hypothetical protein